ncbi:MAG: phosphoribosyltransferase [Patescibacteria group bacterium]
MKVTIFSLYENITSKIAMDYSRMKLGDKIIINRFARQLANIIQKQSLLNGNYAIYATGKYPMNRFCKKNSFLLAEQIAKILKRPMITGSYKYHYEKKLFMDNHVNDRVINGLPVIKNKRVLKKSNYHIVMIDDSICSGKSLCVSLKELKTITDSVSFFSLIKLNKGGYSETQINDFLITNNHKKINTLLQIIRQKGYIFTSHAVRTIDDLTSHEKQQLMAKLNYNRASNLKKAFRVYFGKKFIIQCI